jgi:peptide chain release factor subunit 3
MIKGANQTYYAGLVISAKRGEFEAGFEYGENIKEHIISALSLGVSQIICIINKMDDETVKWSQVRFDNIRIEMLPFLKRLGFNDDEIAWIPVSGLNDDNLAPLSVIISASGIKALNY